MARLIAALLLFVMAAIGNHPLVAQTTAPQLSPQVTEEGQRVVYDLYTWQRRELTKRLPLDHDWPNESQLAEAFSKYNITPAGITQFIPVPSRVLPGVYLVSSNPTLTYLIDCGPEGVALIDPGIQENFDAMIATVEKLGFPKSKIRWVLNTHAHFDHAGSDYLFKKLGAKIMIGALDADAVERGTLVTATSGAYITRPHVPGFTPTTIDQRLFDGEEVPLGNKLLIVISTPGHTSGSSCFLLQVGEKNVLFSGDTLLFDNRLGYQGTAYADNRAYEQSLEKLDQFHLARKSDFFWDVLLPGHGTIVLDRAYMDVDKGWHTTAWDLTHGEPVEALPFATPEYRRLMFGRP